MNLNESYKILSIISDILSVVTITTCFVLKIPQIINIIRVKNTRGINLTGLVMELCSYTIMFSYNFRQGYAILSYMEYPIILIQQLMLIFFVLYYSGLLNLASSVGASIYFSFAFGFLTGILPREILVFLVPLCTPVGASAKVVQLVEIIRMKNSESVSVLTWFISAFTNITRVFTILIDSADSTLLLNFIVNSLLSTSIMFCAIYFKPDKGIDTRKKSK